MDFSGSISVQDLAIVPGLFTLKEVKLAVEVQNSSLISSEGSAKVQLVNGWLVGGHFRIVNGQCDSVELSGSNLNLPVGATGLFLQRVSGFVTGLAEGGPDPLSGQRSPPSWPLLTMPVIVEPCCRRGLAGMQRRACFE